MSQISYRLVSGPGFALVLLVISHDPGTFWCPSCPFFFKFPAQSCQRRMAAHLPVRFMVTGLVTFRYVTRYRRCQRDHDPAASGVHMRDERGYIAIKVTTWVVKRCHGFALSLPDEDGCPGVPEDMQGDVLCYARSLCNDPEDDLRLLHIRAGPSCLPGTQNASGVIVSG